MKNLRLWMLAMPVALLFTSPAFATIALNQAANHGVAGATASTVTISVPPGHFVAVFGAQLINNTSTLAISDSTASLNTYTQTSSGYSSSNASTNRDGLFYSTLTAAVTSITCTWSGALSTSVDCIVLDLTGIALSSQQDASVNSANSSNVSTATSGSLTTTNSNDVLVYCVANSGTLSAQVAGSGFTIPANATTARAACQYEIVAATQSGLTTSMTWTGSRGYGSVFAGFEAIKFPGLVIGGPATINGPGVVD